MPFQIRTQRQNASACKLNYPLTSVSKSLLWIGGQSSSKTKSPCMNIYFWTQKLQRATTNIINNHKTFIYIYIKKKNSLQRNAKSSFHSDSWDVFGLFSFCQPSTCALLTLIQNCNHWTLIVPNTSWMSIYTCAHYSWYTGLVKLMNSFVKVV